MLYDKKWDEKLPVDNFLSAKKLKIPEQQRQDLIRVLGMFEQGKIPKKLFNMKWLGSPKCGTPGCILGWCIALNEGSLPYHAQDPTDLFSPQWSPATPAQAGIAVRNYLTTGDHKWEEILNVV